MYGRKRVKKSCCLRKIRQLTDLCERRDEDPERDDERDLNAVELDVENLVVVNLVMLVTLVAVLAAVAFRIVAGSVAFVGRAVASSMASAVTSIERFKSVAFLNGSES